MEVSLVAEAAKFMVLGMSVVFGFLVVMVFALELQAKIITTFFPEKPQAEPAKPSATKNGSNDKKLIAAITAAIQMYRKDKQS